MRPLAFAVAAAAASVVATPARADIVATLDDTFHQVRTINTTTGTSVTLPPPFSDPDPHVLTSHFSLSPDGRFFVFQRRNSAAGTVRILMVERATGRAADLFNAFDAAADPPSTPTFSLDGTKVLTGRRLDRRNPNSSAGALQSSFTETVVTNFPSGPFPHRIVSVGGGDSPAPGRTLQPAVFGSGLLAFGIEYGSGGPPGRVTVQRPSGAITLSDPARRLANPAVSESLGVSVFESAPATTPFDTKLVFRPLTGLATAAPIPLPAVVNASGSITRAPAFTRDGRYLAFIRGSATSSTRLFVWDTQTQLLLDPNGVQASPNFTDGALALEVRRVIATTTLTGGTVGFSLQRPTTAGLIVQRIIGRQQLLARTMPKLQTIGRVPLGRFGKGRHHTRWGFTIRGHGLARGCYLVTLRALTRNGQLRDLSRPFTVRITHAGRPLISRGVHLGLCGGTGR
jgi:hypothetical protein